jgi:hypothetical protein
VTAMNVQDIDFTKVPELDNRLLDQLNALRDAAPIYWSERHKSWIVTGHAEVVEGLRGDLPLSVAGRLRRVFQVLPARAPISDPTLRRSGTR